MGFDDKWTLKKNVVPRAVQVIQTVGTLLVSEQDSLKNWEVRPAQVGISKFDIITAGEFHLNLVEHVIRDITFDAETKATKSETILGIPTIEIGYRVVVGIKPPSIKVDASAHFHGGLAGPAFDDGFVTSF